MRDQGTTVVLVEQSVNVALTVADTAYFLEKGEVRFHGSTRELLEKPEMLRSVFLHGASQSVDKDEPHGKPSVPVTADRPGPFAAVPPGDGAEVRRIALETHGLTKSFAGNRAMDRLSISLHEGEILGVIGPNGAGKTTLFDLLSGFLLPDQGRISLFGIDITELRPDHRSLLGLARSFQDAKLFGSLTVHQTMEVALDRTLAVREPIAAALNLPEVLDAEKQLDLQVDDLIEVMGLQAYRDKFISELSTGGRRIVDIACQMALEPRVVLFDEPSSGIAQREAEALGPLLTRLRADFGTSLLVIDHDMPMLRSISDRMVALDLGRFVVEGEPTEVLEHPHVVSSYLGASREVIERSGDLEPEHV